MNLDLWANGLLNECLNAKYLMNLNLNIGTVYFNHGAKNTGDDISI